MKNRSRKTSGGSQIKCEPPAKTEAQTVTESVKRYQIQMPRNSHLTVKRRPQREPAFSRQTVNGPGLKSKALSQLVLSVFHGVDLFGKGFERAGFCVVRAAEINLGFDVRELHLPKGKFNGIIAGTPCQNFSLANRDRHFDGYGIEMLEEFARLVLQAAPDWFLLENVPSVPKIEIEGYEMQRFHLHANECGLRQNRIRYFQFGHREGKKLLIKRLPPEKDLERCTMASEGKKKKIRREFVEFCRLQGLPPDFDLPYFYPAYKYEVVGNGVPPQMAQIIADAIRETTFTNNYQSLTFCACDCGREVTGKKIYASARCRKRAQLDREAATAENKSVFTFKA